MCKTLLAQARIVVWQNPHGKQTVVCQTQEEINAAVAKAQKEGCTAKVKLDNRVSAGGRNRKRSSGGTPGRRQVSFSH